MVYCLTQATCAYCKQTSDVYVETLGNTKDLSGASVRYFCSCNNEVLFRMTSLILLTDRPTFANRGTLLIDEETVL
jgi:hypothetical protein